MNPDDGPLAAGGAEGGGQPPPAAEPGLEVPEAPEVAPEEPSDPADDGGAAASDPGGPAGAGAAAEAPGDVAPGPEVPASAAASDPGGPDGAGEAIEATEPAAEEPSDPADDGADPGGPANPSQTDDPGAAPDQTDDPADPGQTDDPSQTDAPDDPNDGPDELAENDPKHHLVQFVALFTLEDGVFASTGNGEGPTVLGSTFSGMLAARHPPTTATATHEFPENMNMFAFPAGISLRAARPADAAHSFAVTDVSGDHLHVHCLTRWVRMAPEIVSVARLQAGAKALSEGAAPAEMPDALWEPQCLCVVSFHEYHRALQRALELFVRREAAAGDRLSSFHCERLFRALRVPVPRPDAPPVALTVAGRRVPLPHPRAHVWERPPYRRAWRCPRAGCNNKTSRSSKNKGGATGATADTERCRLCRLCRSCCYRLAAEELAQAEGASAEAVQRAGELGALQAGGGAGAATADAPPPLCVEALPVFDADFDPLFASLEPRHVISLFNALLCEQSVIVLAPRVEQLHPALEVVKKLLFPIDWPHIYIPLLPEELFDFLQAPFPYLIGVHAEAFARMGERPETAAVVDLGANSFSPPPDPLLSTTLLPPRHTLKLYSSVLRFADAFRATHPDAGELLPPELPEGVARTTQQMADRIVRAANEAAGAEGAEAPPQYLMVSVATNDILHSSEGSEWEEGAAPQSRAGGRGRLVHVSAAPPSASAAVDAVAAAAAEELGEDLDDVERPAGLVDGLGVRRAFLSALVSLFKSFRHFVKEPGGRTIAEHGMSSAAGGSPAGAGGESDGSSDDSGADGEEERKTDLLGLPVPNEVVREALGDLGADDADLEHLRLDNLFDTQGFLAEMQEDCVDFMTRFLQTQLYSCFLHSRIAALTARDLFDRLSIQKMRLKAMRMSYFANKKHTGMIWKAKRGTITSRFRERRLELDGLELRYYKPSTRVTQLEQQVDQAKKAPWGGEQLPQLQKELAAAKSSVQQGTFMLVQGQTRIHIPQIPTARFKTAYAFRVCTPNDSLCCCVRTARERRAWVLAIKSKLHTHTETRFLEQRYLPPKTARDLHRWLRRRVLNQAHRGYVETASHVLPGAAAGGHAMATVSALPAARHPTGSSVVGDDLYGSAGSASSASAALGSVGGSSVGSAGSGSGSGPNAKRAMSGRYARSQFATAPDRRAASESDVRRGRSLDEGDEDAMERFKKSFCVLS